VSREGCRTFDIPEASGLPLRASYYHLSVKKPSNSENSRRADIVSLKDSIQALLKAYRLQGKLNEVTVVASWEKVMGKAVALKTQEVYVSNSKLFVRLSSAPLKHELVMAKTRVMDLINDAVGETVIKEVVFL
jgi:predicted nucleic acid-binding Zn ribbon protein